MTQLDRTGASAVKILFLLALTTMLAGGGVSYIMLSGQPDGTPHSVLIERGKSAATIAELLAAEGVIAHPKLFRFVLRLTDADKKIRAGEFQFRKNMRALDAMKVLYYSEPVLHAITIPEGWNTRQIAAGLARAGLADEKKFLSIAQSRLAAEKHGFNAPHLEGFLFPTTYQFSRIDGEGRIIEQMVGQFKKAVEKGLAREATAKGYTLEQILTLSSIIERETGNASERELVSSVFHNRLRKRMRLQSDPTTIYGIDNFNGNLTKEDLRRYTPYNTYVIFGLPPGPIANPGVASIRAALNPATTDYLYFVSNNQGKHIFSKDYRQHSRNVTNTQGRPKKPPTRLRHRR